MQNLLRNVLVFGRLLRNRGLEVHMGRMLDVAEALQRVDIGSRDDVYHTCLTLLVHRREDLALFDRAFDQFWGGAREHRTPRRGSREGPHEESAGKQRFVLDSDSPSALSPPGEADMPGGMPTWSEAVRLASKDFAAFTPDEIAVARLALERLAWNPGLRRTRRWVAGPGPRVDLRRALAGSLRTGGDVVRLPRRRRRIRPRPLLLLCDVSGSMERYSRMLLHFAHAMGARHRGVETFLFSTQLTRITTALRVRTLDDAATAVARTVPDWSGGTRIGEALVQFHQRWRRRVLHPSTVVLLISDGWDRGDPLVLRDEIARLQRSCHRLIWLSPLIGTADYAPLTRGLQAALPFVDDFLPARTLSNLADLAVHLNAAADERRKMRRRESTHERPARQ